MHKQLMKLEAVTGERSMAKILIVDDERGVRVLIGQILEVKRHACVLACDALEARGFLKEHKFELIVSDINMPGESGLDFLKYALSEYPDTAAIVITGLDDPVAANVAMEIGVYDYIIKPFEANGVIISVTNVLRRRQLEIDSRTYREGLENMVMERTIALQESMEKLKKALDGSVHAMSIIVESRDPYTAGHQRRVADLACAIAGRIGLSEDQTDGLRMGAIIHDIGKISIPAEILSKPGELSEIEFSLVKAHPKVAYEILRSIEFPWPIAQMVLQHHERMDGSGYPSGLTGEEIITEARILSVADVVESMSSHRPYRPSLGIDKALEEISEGKGVVYDTEVAEACLCLFKEKVFEFSS